jgi:hypothetical protein
MLVDQDDRDLLYPSSRPRAQKGEQPARGRGPAYPPDGKRARGPVLRVSGVETCRNPVQLACFGATAIED